jgi:uncharacterized protein
VNAYESGLAVVSGPEPAARGARGPCDGGPSPPDIAGPCPKFSWGSIQRTIPARARLTAIDLDVTEACNLGCTYCFKWQKKPVHMDESTAKGAIDWLLDSSGGYKSELRVNFMGGEPLLRFDLIRRIVPYGKCRARQRGQSLHFGCTTNCTVLTDEILAFWRRFGMGFHCSIDGVPEVQNANRPSLGGGPSSGLVERNAPKILAYRPEVTARATITPFSAPYLVESAKYLMRLGFTSITFKIAVNCDWKAADFEMLKDRYEKLGDLFLESATFGKKLDIMDFTKGLGAIHSSKAPPRMPCGAGHGMALVDPRGEIWPCHRFGPGQCGGQFRLGRLGEPFNDSLRDVFLNYDLFTDAQAGCRRCPAAQTCQGWCYVECVDCTRTLYDPGSAFCAVRRILHAEIVRIDHHLKSRYPEILERLLRDTE